MDNPSSASSSKPRASRVSTRAPDVPPPRGSEIPRSSARISSPDGDGGGRVGSPPRAMTPISALASAKTVAAEASSSFRLRNPKKEPALQRLCIYNANGHLDRDLSHFVIML